MQPINVKPANEATMKYDGAISSLSIKRSSLSVKKSKAVSTVAEAKVRSRIHGAVMYFGSMLL